MTPSPSAWTRLRAAADPYTRRAFGLYTCYRIDRAEYLDTFTGGFDALRERFRAAGYRKQVISAAKRHPEHGGLHLLSVRRVPDEHPTTIREYVDGGPRIVREYAPGECQHHAHAFASPVAGQFDVFSHYEVRPLADPVEHYRPTYGETYLQGLADPELEL